ncbi:MAG: response regulator [bacterium]|nr:response regulator [bacterium]
MDKKNILFIEDNTDISRILRYKIEKGNYLLTDVSDTNKALELIDRQKFDLIILDMKVPLLQDGVNTFHQIKEKISEVPIIILSVAADEPPVRDLNANAFILKPFELKKVQEKIDELVNSE